MPKNLTLEGAFGDFENWYESFTVREMKTIEAAYKEALEKAKKDLAKYHEYYAKQGKLTLGEMQKYNRLEKMTQEIQHELEELMKTQKKDIKASSEKLFSETYDRMGWIAEQATGLDLKWYELPKDYVKKAVQNPISGLTLDETLEKDREEILWKIKQELTQGVVRGESYSETAHRLKEVLNGNYAKAQRIIWTENHRCKEEAQFDAMTKLQDKGIEAKRMWVATLDDRTRDTHRELDGKMEDKDGYFRIRGMKTKAPGMFGIAAEDINCRCTTIFVFEGNEPRTRMIQGKGISDYLTYEEWKTGKKKTPEVVKTWYEEIMELGNELDTIKWPSDKDLADIRKEYKEKSDSLITKFSEEMRELGFENIVGTWQFVGVGPNSMYKGFSPKMLEDQANSIRKKLIKDLDKLQIVKNKQINTLRESHQKEVLKKISKHRKLFDGEIQLSTEHRTSKEARQQLNNAAKFFPDEWIQTSNNQSKALYVRLTSDQYKRAYYSDVFGEMLLNKGQLDTAIHELAHRIEFSNPRIHEKLVEFYKMRTKGEKFVRLRDITGLNYGKNEVTKVDKWAHPYMGMFYWNDYTKTQEATELLSIGLEALFFGKHDVWQKDPEFMKFIYGLVVSM